MSSRANSITQDWVEAQVAEAQLDNEPGLYSPTQAGRRPKALYRRWMRLNRVLGAETGDTWLAAGGWGLGVALLLTLLLAWGGWERVGGALALGFGLLAGGGVGLVVFYSRLVKLMYRETYIEAIVSEYHSALDADSDVTDVVVCFLQRLPFYHRPEVFEGNGGRTGFKDKDAVLRLKTEFGVSALDLLDSRDYYDLPRDPSSLVATTSIIRFALIKLVREAGALYRLVAVKPPRPHWSKQLRGAGPWLISGAFILGAVLLTTS